MSQIKLGGAAWLILSAMAGIDWTHVLSTIATLVLTAGAIGILLLAL